MEGSGINSKRLTQGREKVRTPRLWKKKNNTCVGLSGKLEKKEAKVVRGEQLVGELATNKKNQENFNHRILRHCRKQRVRVGAAQKGSEMFSKKWKFTKKINNGPEKNETRSKEKISKRGKRTWDRGKEK